MADQNAYGIFRAATARLYESLVHQPGKDANLGISLELENPVNN